MKRIHIILLSVLCMKLFCVNEDLPKVFIECGSCDHDFIRTEIDFVNYVIDRKVADIFIMITSQNTGSGGSEYNVEFCGRQQFEGMKDTLKVIAANDDSQDIVRKKLVKCLKTGLVNYFSHTKFSDNIEVVYNFEDETEKTVDEWDNWVFTVGGNGYANGDKTYLSYYLTEYLIIKRITEDWIFKNTYIASYSEDIYDYGDDDIERYDSQNISADITLVKSINDHWSGGIVTGGNNSTYSNRELYIYFYPKIEYNIFPYSESSNRELRLLYGVGVSYTDYYETTIYNKNEDLKLKQSLELALEVNKDWGTIETSLNWSNHIDDLNMNRLDAYISSSLNLFRGFSLNLNGGYSIIHDQISLVKGDTSDEDLLLRRKEMETSYSYWTSVGLSYTFGSIYNNIVNPRFGN